VFSIVLGPPAQRFLKKCEVDIQDRIFERLEALKENPFPHDVKRIVNRKDKVFRLRVGDYRIQYVVFYEKNELLVSDIDNRSRVYKKK